MIHILSQTITFSLLIPYFHLQDGAELSWYEYLIKRQIAKKSGTFRSTQLHHLTPTQTHSLRDIYPMSDQQTPQDPPAYLAQSRFSQKIKCPRTGSAVSFAEIGDEDGVPLLWMMPSGGSRWFAVAHGISLVPWLSLITTTSSHNQSVS